MRNIVVVVFLLMFGKYAVAQNAIIPKVNQYTALQGTCVLNSRAVIDYQDASFQRSARLLKQALEKSSTASLPSAKITFVKDATVKGGEAYHLTVKPHEVVIAASSDTGVFYGAQTLIQLMMTQPGGIKACEIKDAPRFAYRGSMVDVSRHMFSVAFLKQYIDLLAFYKINTFHWHLTDDQGWRIEIKRYPQLQNVAAYRDQTIIGHKKESPHRFDGKRYGGYYTQEQVKEVIAYATERYVAVIPEIEMPGHASAALAAYPYLGCTGGPYKTAQFWGIFDDVFCAGNDSTFTFLENVLDEVIPLFPGQYIHIGGDECPKVRWNNCPKCKQRMQREHLADAHALQSYFVRRMEKFVNAKGKRLIGWDEIVEGGLTPNATVMAWNGDHIGIEAALQKHDVILSPESILYFDYYQSTSLQEPVAAAGYTYLKKVYDYEPIPANTPAEALPYIIGIQANTWSEYLSTPAHAQYMYYPRMLAFAEVAWQPVNSKDYNDFHRRWQAHKQVLTKLGVHYADVDDELIGKVQYNPSKGLQLALSSSLDNKTIQYTTHGITKKYSSPITITKSGEVTATQTVNGKTFHRTYTQQFTMHKAIGKKVTLKNAPKGNYAADASVLVNGVRGSHRYNDGQWCGFSGDNMEAVIDFEKSQSIRQVKTSFLDYHWQRMWRPTEVQYFVSDDGQNFTPITGKVEETNLYHTQSFTPVKARYLKVILQNKGIVPPGEYGAGAKAWLMVDEIEVN